MSEPHWTGYVGMATGTIGAITGVAGAIMGYVSYRKTKSTKSMDLRIELRKAINELQSKLALLEKLIDQANGSRRATSAAAGISSSSMMDHWTQTVQSDKKIVQQLTQTAPSSKNDYDDLDFKELESKLIEVHQLQIQVDLLTARYNAALQDDKDFRVILREQSASLRRDIKI